MVYILQPGDLGYDANNQHGIIAAPADQSSGTEWGCGQTAMNSTESGIGYGAANTVAIISGCADAGIAARMCDDLVLNGFSDWYLPSIDELDLLYQNLYINGIGSFNQQYYWSSTEYNAASALRFNFSSQATSNFIKSYPHNVRAIRSF